VYSPRLARLAAEPSPEAVDRFWSEVTATGTPLIEPSDDTRVLVTFLWRGEARSTRAWWNIDVPLTRLPGTDLWYGTRAFPADLRTIYCLVHDDTETLPNDPVTTGATHLDPDNPQRMPFPADPLDPSDSYHWASVLELPHAPAEPWTTDRPGVTPGRLTTASISSAALGNEYPVTVYRPADVPAEPLPALVVFDGYLAQTVLRLPTVLDNLIGAGRIPPMAALFIHTFDDRRERDLSPLPPIEHFVVDELLPWARAGWHLGADTGRDMVTGASRGGLIAAYLALRRPDVFGAVIAQSGSFWWPEPDQGQPCWLIREVSRLPRSDVRFYLDVGTMETMPAPGGGPTQLSVCRQMRDALQEHGHHVTYAEFTGGHDYINWRRTLADGLLAVCAAPATSTIASA
jgi:enterochelin esterase family protein